MRPLFLPLLLGFAAAPGPKGAPEDVAFALEHLEKRAGHFFRTKGVDWKRVASEMTKAAAKAKTPEEHYAVLVRLTARLRDGHAAVQAKDATKGLPGPWPSLDRGPGIFWCLSGGKVLVKNSWGAAEGAGVHPGTEVVAVEGVPARKWLDRRIEELRDTAGFSTQQQAEYFACHWGLGGPAGSTLPLELREPDGKTRKVTLTRSEGGIVARGPAFPPPGLKELGRQSYGKTARGNAYVHLRDTPQDLPSQMDAILAEVGDAPGLVLDFRANGGGGFDHVGLLGRFVPKGKTLSFTEVSYPSAGDRPYAGPVVVLVDAGVRSAGETGSGIFKEDGRAFLIGESPTAGMSSSKTNLELPSGLFSIYFSVNSNKERFNGGKGIEGIGVQPHEIVPYEAKDLAAGVDTLVRRAEEILARFPEGKVPYKASR